MALVEMFKYWGYDSLETGTHPDGTPIYDRAIDSADVALFNELLYTSGIDKNYEDCFKIVPGDGLTIIRQPGHASLGGRPALDPNPRTVTLVSGNKYYYVMESNAELEYRMAREGVLLAAETSIPPQRDENHYQIILALIDVPSGVSQITADMITDLRFNDDCCGVITINANYDFEQLLITADDIHDTDTKLIPVKTGGGSLVLRDDGYAKVASANLAALEYIKINGVMTVLDNNDNEILKVYNDRITFGDYTAKRNGRNIDIEYRSEGLSHTGTPESHNVLRQDGLTITDLDNTLNSSSNNTYATLMPTQAGWNTTEIIYTYNNNSISLGSTSITITAKIKGPRNSTSGAAGESFTLALYNLDTNTIISNTETQFRRWGTSAAVNTASWTFNNLAEIGTNNFGLRLYIYDYARTEDMIEKYIYGSDITIEQAFDGEVIGQLTPDGIITSPGGTVQTMMTQAILDNKQDILLLKEGIDI